jgi:nitrilase
MGRAFTVAAVQAAYVLMDREATTDRVEQLIGTAAGQGAELIVFPEVFVPGSPIWIDSVPIWDGDEAWFARLVDQAVVVPSPTTERIAAAAEDAGAYVVARRASRLCRPPQLRDGSVPAAARVLNEGSE